MSYILKQIGDTPNAPYYELECDTLADIELISTSMLPMGSVANILEDGASIVLNGDGEWRSAKTGNGILTDVFEWVGDIEGRPVVVVSDFHFYWVSECTPSINDFKNGVIVAARSEGSEGFINLTYEDILHWSQGVDINKALSFEVGFVVQEDNFTVEGITFPKKGIYLQALPEDPENNHITYIQIPGYNKFLNTSALKNEADIGSGDSGDSGSQKTYSVTVTDSYGCYNRVFVNGDFFLVNYKSRTFKQIAENTCITLIVESDGPTITQSGCLTLLHFGILRDENEGVYKQVFVYSVSGDELTGTITIDG